MRRNEYLLRSLWPIENLVNPVDNLVDKRRITRLNVRSRQLDKFRRLCGLENNGPTFEVLKFEQQRCNPIDAGFETRVLKRS